MAGIGRSVSNHIPKRTKIEALNSLTSFCFAVNAAEKGNLVLVWILTESRSIELENPRFAVRRVMDIDLSSGEETG
jgi:hypothetical protein